MAVSDRPARRAASHTSRCKKVDAQCDQLAFGLTVLTALATVDVPWQMFFSNFKVRNKDPGASDSIPLFWRFQNFFTTQCRTSYRLGGGETICPPPPMAVRLAADLRPSADGSAGHTWLSCRQPACLQPNAAARLVQLCHGTERQTYGRIAVSLNSPSYGGDIISRGYIACVKNEFDSLGCFDIEHRHFSTLCAIEIK